MRQLLFKSVVAGMAALILVAGSFISEAQEEGPAPGPRGAGQMRQGRGAGGMRGPGGMRGEFDRTRMREMMAERLQQAVGCTSEEWKVIGPRVEKVTDLRMQPRMRGGMMGRRGRRGDPEGPARPGRPGGPPPLKEVADLTKALDSENTPKAEMRQGRGAGGMRGPGGMRGEFDRTRMREMMAERLQQAVGCTSEEWKVIGPRVEKVTDLRMQPRMRGGMMGRRGRRGDPEGPARPGRPGGPPPLKEVADLTKALDSENTPKAEIESKLKAFRAAAKKREEALKKARTELREVLTLRQEARLVLMGILD